MQRVSDAKVDRGYHVWYQRQDGSFKCVLCGGITRVPTDVCECRYEELTKDEKEMCPPRDPKDKRTAEEMSKAERREEKKGKRK